MSQLSKIINPDQFKFVVLPGSDPDPQYITYYNSAYECWYNVWKDAFKELDMKRQMHSDDFTRQTEINCLFYGTQCIALLFLRWADFKTLAIKDDSYFKLWTHEDFDKLTKYGSDILIISNTTVHQNWRGKDLTISIKDLILYLTIQRFLSSSASAMTAVTRNTRGIDKMIERFGAVMFKKDIPNFNNTDLVNIGAFYRKDMTEGTDPEVIKVGRNLISKIITVSRTKTAISDKNNLPSKKVA